VGVNRIQHCRGSRRENCPHARGGEPFFDAKGEFIGILSPRPWG